MYIDRNKRHIADEIRDTGDISPRLEEEIKEAIREFKALHNYG